MATADFIGALISLISKSDIRYQGVLASINPEQATIALENVRSWGTEGRLAALGRPSDEILPSDQVYGFIMFRAADVKDLKIDNPNPSRSSQPPPPPTLNDPAILNSSAAPAPAPAPGPGPGQGQGQGPFNAHPPPNFGNPMAGPGMFGVPPVIPPQPHNFGARSPQPPTRSAEPSKPKESAPVPVLAAAAAAAPSPALAPPAKDNSPNPTLVSKVPANASADKVLEEMSKLSVSKPSSLPPASASLPPIPHAAAAAAAANRNTRRGPSAPTASSLSAPSHPPVSVPVPMQVSVSVPNKDFDFESSNAKFSKDTLDAIPPAPESFYEKSGFFDNISSEVKERYDRTAPSQRGRGRANRLAEDRKNLQTFGDLAPQSGRGRGRVVRGRGARGRGRGRSQQTLA